MNLTTVYILLGVIITLQILILMLVVPMAMESSKPKRGK